MNLFDLCVYKNLNKGSGGDVDVSSLVATENKTYNAGEGKAYNPVVVNVPTPPPSLQSLTASHNGYFVPSSGYQGFSEVNVDVALPQNAYLLESQKDDVVTIQHGAEFDMPKLIASIEPQQSGSGDPSPENVRPISGWTACNVVRTGKNLVDAIYLGYYNTQNGSIVNQGIRVRTEIKKWKAGTYTVSGSTSVTGKTFQVVILQWVNGSNGNNTCTYDSGWHDAPQTITLTQDTYMSFVFRHSDNSNISVDDVTVQVEIGNQATAYESYSGNTYTINFVDGSNPLTVYKGELDVLSGLLKAYPHYDSYNGETINGEWISDRDAYSVGATPTIGAEVQVISGSDYTTYQQTANNVKSLEGVNNLWADTGEVDVQIWTKEVTS